MSTRSQLLVGFATVMLMAGLVVAGLILNQPIVLLTGLLLSAGLTIWRMVMRARGVTSPRASAVKLPRTRTFVVVFGLLAVVAAGSVAIGVALMNFFGLAMIIAGVVLGVVVGGYWLRSEKTQSTS